MNKKFYRPPLADKRSPEEDPPAFPFLRLWKNPKVPTFSVIKGGGIVGNLRRFALKKQLFNELILAVLSLLLLIFWLLLPPVVFWEDGGSFERLRREPKF